MWFIVWIVESSVKRALTHIHTYIHSQSSDMIDFNNEQWTPAHNLYYSTGNRFKWFDCFFLLFVSNFNFWCYIFIVSSVLDIWNNMSRTVYMLYIILFSKRSWLFARNSKYFWKQNKKKLSIKKNKTQHNSKLNSIRDDKLILYIFKCIYFMEKWQWK